MAGPSEWNRWDRGMSFSLEGQGPWAANQPGYLGEDVSQVALARLWMESQLVTELALSLALPQDQNGTTS